MGNFNLLWYLFYMLVNNYKLCVCVFVFQLLLCVGSCFEDEVPAQLHGCLLIQSQLFFLFLEIKYYINVKIVWSFVLFKTTVLQRDSKQFLDLLY